jgi:hypothetical protein
MERITLKEFEARWRNLLQHDKPVLKHRQRNDVEDEQPDTDPFDCTSVTIPPTYTMVDAMIGSYIDAWKDLDDRKILATPETFDNDESAAACEDGQATTRSTGSAKNNSLPKWFKDRVRLPEKFDYESKQSGPPPDDGQGDRVVSLDDPTQTLSYHRELWKLFRTIPTAAELENNAAQNPNMPNMQRIIKQCTIADQDTFKSDTLGLSRIRWSDRHDLPPVVLPVAQQQQGPIIATTVATIWFECWKGQTARGFYPE